MAHTHSQKEKESTEVEQKARALSPAGSVVGSSQVVASRPEALKMASPLPGASRG